jgi:hypothetical protein
MTENTLRTETEQNKQLRLKKDEEKLKMKNNSYWRKNEDLEKEHWDITENITETRMRIEMAKTEERRYIDTWLRKEQTKDEEILKLKKDWWLRGATTEI